MNTLIGPCKALAHAWQHLGRWPMLKALAAGLVLNFGLGLAAAQAQTLRIESWRKDDQIFWDKYLIPAFQKLHPEIQLKFQPEAPLAYDTQLEARLATRRAGDLIFCRPFDANVRMQAKSYLLPLDEAALKNFKLQARQAWTSDNGNTTFCLPVAYVMHGLFYNKKVFHDLNLQPPSTWSQLFRLLSQVAASKTVTPLALGTADMWESTQVVFTGLGANFWEGEKGRLGLIDGSVKFTDPGFLKAWQTMAQLKPYMHPQQNSMTNSDMQLLFATGHAAVYPSGSWDIDFLRNTSFAYKKPIELGVFKPPLEHEGQTCHISVHPDFGIGVNKSSPNRAAALKFIAWLGSADFAQLLTDTLTGYFPLSDHPVKINDPLGQEMLSWRQTCQDTIRLNAQKINRVWPPMEDELWYVNVKVLNQEMSPEEAAQHIQNVHQKNNYLK
ncbi:ABC transporter substrate-binding protein [Limnohabitans sp.]|jgi:raffinose/stachyose/melibiose transport system substrate-binding protein|uniref:ABC transporter substrate-binding protein n=1 Tax=Limnohabitans sp. TaxID=1907725 RepID=UPI0037BFB151